MDSAPKQLPLSLPEVRQEKKSTPNHQANKLVSQDRAFHDWYRFVLAFPPHLVRTYIENFGLKHDQVLLDPFCGTGTTLVEAKLIGIPSVGIEAHPFTAFASAVKVDWEITPDLLMAKAETIAQHALHILKKQGLDEDQPFEGNVDVLPLKSLSDDATKLILTNSISPLPLHKILTLLDCLKKHHGESYYPHGLLALASTMVFKASNLHFGPEVGVGKRKHDFPVVMTWLSEMRKMADDLREVAGKPYSEAKIYLADARKPSSVVQPNSIDAVITSPPYPNEKDYTRTTRLEAVILGFIQNKAELRELKRRLVRSNTRGVYKEDDDDGWISTFPKIQHISETIEKRRVELGKTSGFEKLYGRVTRLYFGGMARHFAELRHVLRPSAQLAYVVGDQASYLRVMIPTGQLLAEIAQSLGYEVVRIDPFRTRFATATKEQLREEVIVLRWTGRT